MPSLEEKSENAFEALTQLIAHLERCNEYTWAGRFYPIKEAIESFEFDKAIRLYKLIPMPNTPETPRDPNESAIKEYERAIFQIATSINKVRNREGTGHGRLCITSLTQEESHSIIESVGVV